MPVKLVGVVFTFRPKDRIADAVRECSVRRDFYLYRIPCERCRRFRTSSPRFPSVDRTRTEDHTERRKKLDEAAFDAFLGDGLLERSFGIVDLLRVILRESVRDGEQESQQYKTLLHRTDSNTGLSLDRRPRDHD